MSAYTTRHDFEDTDEDTENLPVIADAIAGRVVSPREDYDPFPQVITPTAVRPGYGQPYAPHPHQILDPLTVSRLLGSPTRQAPRWLVGVKDFFGHAADHHVLPAAGVLTMAGVSVWAHSQPYHPLIGGSIIAVGAYLVRAGIKAHRVHGADADATFTKGAAGAGATLALVGVGACVGLSPWMAVAVALGLAVAYTGWHQWVHHKLERTREYSVALVAAGNTGPTPLPPAGYAPDALPYSDEEGRLRAAFLKLNAPDVILSPVRRVADGVWSVYADLIDTKVTAEQLENDPNRLASYTRGARRVEVLPGARQSQVKLVVYDGDDPLEEPVPGPGPRVTSILQPVGLGRFEDSTEISQPLAWNHALVGGATDNGKSGVLNAAIIGTLGCRDVVRIGIDCKAGAPEFGVYRPVMFHLAENPQDGMRVLAGLEAVYEYRGQLLKEKGVPSEENEDGVPVRKWRPEFGPFILALIDELERMTSSVPGAAKRIQDLNALARYVAIIRWDATQTPSRGVFGGKTDARLNYQIRAGVRTMEIQANNMIMGPGAHTRGWDLRTLNRPGKMMIQSRQYDRPRVGRAYYYSDEEIARLVAQYKGQVADLDEGSAEAFWEGYNAAFDTEESDGDGDGPRGGRRTDPVDVAQAFHRDGRTLHAVPTYPNSGTAVEVKYQDLWALLGEQDEPVSAPDLDALAKSAGHEFNSESWIRRPLRYWLKNGWIESERRSGTDYFWRPDVQRQRRDAHGAAS